MDKLMAQILTDVWGEKLCKEAQEAETRFYLREMANNVEAARSLLVRAAGFREAIGKTDTEVSKGLSLYGTIAQLEWTLKELGTRFGKLVEK